MSLFNDRQPAVLALETGEVFLGLSCGCSGMAVADLVFNTSMTGYQEILTDPSYKGQIIVFTASHIGSVGVNIWDNESDRVHSFGIVVRDLIDSPSNWQSSSTLNQFLMDQGVVGIQSIDTRALVILLRQFGSQKGCIYSAQDAYEPSRIELALSEAKACPDLSGVDWIPTITAAQPFVWNQNPHCLYKSESVQHRIVVLDFGVKRSILDALVRVGGHVTVLPGLTSVQSILSYQPDGIVLSNGPGNPEACASSVSLVRELTKTNIPLLGICLGHQLLALANGLRIVKMSFGHHGSNHPVQSLNDQRVFITSQNHCYAVDETSLSACPNCEITHRSLFDHSIQGLYYHHFPGFSFQGHPEGGSGPHDLFSLFEQFCFLMLSFKERRYASSN